MLHKNRDRLGSVLQIAIHQDNGVTDRAVESSAERRLMSKIAGKRNDKNAGVGLDGLLEYLHSSIRASIVNKQELVRTARNLVQHRTGALQQLRQRALFVVNRDRD